MLTRLWVMIPLCFASGCVTATQEHVEPPPISGSALCEESQAARTKLAAALANTEDIEVLVAGGELIAILDAGCAN